MNRKRYISFSFVIIAGILTLASVAYACTIYKGKMRVVTGTTESYAYGNNSGMGYCSGPVGGAQLGTSGGTIRVIVSKTNGDNGCPSSQLAASNPSIIPLLNRVYYVRWYNGRGFDWTGNPRTYTRVADCMEGASGSRLGGTYTVNSNGDGDETRTVPTGQTANDQTDPGDESAVCVSSNGGGQGNQVPLNIV